MAKSKCRGAWGGKTEAQGVLGGQNRSSGVSWGRKTEAQASFGVDLGSVWGDSGGILGRFVRIRGDQGRAPGKFSKN